LAVSRQASDGGYLPVLDLSLATRQIRVALFYLSRLRQHFLLYRALNELGQIAPFSSHAS